MTRSKERVIVGRYLLLLLLPDDGIVYGLTLSILSGSRGGSRFAVFGNYVLRNCEHLALLFRRGLVGVIVDFLHP